MFRKSLVLAGLLISSLLLSAQTAAPAPATGFAAEFLKQLDDLESKTVKLAEAIPEEKYSWRPQEGVRSVGEVYAHTTAGNYGFMRSLGLKAPAGLDLRNIEKLTDKAKIVAALKQSFVDVRGAVSAMTPADLEKMVKLFGAESSGRNVLFGVSVHISEHLGQSIAYARSVGVTPPWTAERQAQPPPAKPAEPAKK